MNQELANITALQIIAFLASDEKYLSWLMNETGMGVEELKASPDNPDLISGILDFLLNHEDILIECCDSLNIDPAMPAKIRPCFPGASMEYF